MATDVEMKIGHLVERIATTLTHRRLTMATAESCTGGLIAGALTERAGSSLWFERGLVTYSNQAKIGLLGVPESLLEQFGAVSEPCAQAMAEGCLRSSGADLALSVTGIAGPGGGSADKPVGTVCFGWSAKGTRAHAVTCHFDGDRHQVRMHSVCFALEGLLARLDQVQDANASQ